MKFVTSDYVMDPTTHAKLGFQGSNGSVIIVVKHTHLVSIFSFYLSIFLYFLSCSPAQVAL